MMVDYKCQDVIEYALGWIVPPELSCCPDCHEAGLGTYGIYVNKKWLPTCCQVREYINETRQCR